MTRHWNEGSAVQSVTFERATRTLRVQFTSGETYDFADVPERLYDELAHSPAPDAFFHEHIAEEFSATRVGDVDLAEMAHERREDALLGAPLAESVAIETVDEREDALGLAGTTESGAVRSTRHTRRGCGGGCEASDNNHDESDHDHDEEQKRLDKIKAIRDAKRKAPPAPATPEPASEAPAVTA